MRGGSDLQTYVDILVPSNAKLTLIKVCFQITSLATFNFIFYRAKLVNNFLPEIQINDSEQGEGTVHLIGSHCIDFYGNMDGEGDYEEDEDDEMEVGEVCFLPFWV